MVRNILFLLCFISFSSNAQIETRNIVIVTLDGFRWQELFRGVDLEVVNHHELVIDSDIIKHFAHPTIDSSRKDLLPFFWNEIGVKGQLYGNRDYNNNVNCANPYWFSYPGYHEIFVGSVDRRVRSNEKFINPNSTVFDFLNSHQDFKNSIAAFTTWDVFPYILRESATSFPVNSGTEPVVWRDLTDFEMSLNNYQAHIARRTDSVTFYLAFEHLKRRHPRVLYVALDETDHFSHKGKYDQYLMAAHRSDKWISELWNWIQTDAGYKDRTTLLITTDHGRGKNPKKSWRSHGRLMFGSSETWIAVIGPDTRPLGEMRTSNQLYQKQLAKTIAAFFGKTYQNEFSVGNAIEAMFSQDVLVAGKTETH